MQLSTEALKKQVSKFEELSTQLTFRISRMSKLLEVDGGARLAETGINLTGYRILLVVSIFEELSVSDLSKIMVIDRAQVSRSASDLIRQGWLESRSDRRSKRKKILALTQRGGEDFGAIRERFDQRQTQLETLLSDEELSVLSRAIDKISHYVEAKAENRNQAS